MAAAPRTAPPAAPTSVPRLPAFLFRRLHSLANCPRRAKPLLPATALSCPSMRAAEPAGVATARSSMRPTIPRVFCTAHPAEVSFQHSSPTSLGSLRTRSCEVRPPARRATATATADATTSAQAFALRRYGHGAPSARAKSDFPARCLPDPTQDSPQSVVAAAVALSLVAPRVALRRA